MNTTERLCEISDQMSLWVATYPVAPDIMSAQKELNKPVDQCSLEDIADHVKFLEDQVNATTDFVANTLEPKWEEFDSLAQENELLCERRKRQIRERNKPLKIFMCLDKGIDLLLELSTAGYQKSRAVVMQALVILNIHSRRVWSHIKNNQNMSQMTLTAIVIGIFTTTYFYFRGFRREASPYHPT